MGQWLEDWAEEQESSMAGPGSYGRGADAGGADAGGSAGGGAKTTGDGDKNQSADDKAKQDQKEQEDKEDQARLDLKADTATPDQKKDLDDRINQLAERLEKAEGAEKSEIQDRIQTLTSLRVSLNPPPPVPAAPPPAPPPPPPAAPFIGSPATVAANDPAVTQQNAAKILQLAPPAPPAPAAPPPAPPPPPQQRQGGGSNILAGSLSPALPVGPRTTLSKIAPQAQTTGTKSAPAPEQLAQGGGETLPIRRDSGSTSTSSASPALSASLPPAPPAAPPPPASGRPLAAETTYTPPQPAPSLSPPPPAPAEVTGTDSDLTLSVVRAAPSQFSIGGTPAVDLPPAMPSLPSGRTEAPGDSRSFAAPSDGSAPSEDRPSSGRYAAEPRDERPSRGFDEPAPPPEPERKVREIVVEVDPPALPTGYNVPEGLDPEEPAPETKPKKKTDPNAPVKISALPSREIPEDLAQLKKALAEEDKRVQEKANQVSDLDTFTNAR